MQTSQNIFICVFLFIFSILIAYKEYKRENRIINVISIFSIGFLLPFTFSFLKLSKLSYEYDIRTIILVIGSFLSFYYGVRIGKKYDVLFLIFNNNKNKKEISKVINKKINIRDKKHKFDLYNIIFKHFDYKNIIIVIAIITFTCFLIEVMVLGFIPLFSYGTPHAYSTFHIFGIHYITTLYFILPALAILNVKNNRFLLIFTIIYSVVMSLLLVSRSLLIMTMVAAGLAYALSDRKFTRTKKNFAHKVRPYIVLVLFLGFVGLYILITVLRSHSVDYLNDIFEMKDNTPIFITQPYMYITHGFENLNYLITHHERFTFGRRMLAPLFTLLRTKKYFPLVTEAPFYHIKDELTSKPIIYDYYYDFSIVGTFIIVFFIGYIVKKIEIKNYKENNVYYNLFFCIICYYLLFSFFQSYLSLLDTWFYIIFTYLLYIISTFKKTKK